MPAADTAGGAISSSTRTRYPVPGAVLVSCRVTNSDDEWLGSLLSVVKLTVDVAPGGALSADHDAGSDQQSMSTVASVSSP
jgi:hypothetical protein